jgi:transmembrane 9 superfamily member 2/4
MRALGPAFVPCVLLLALALATPAASASFLAGIAPRDYLPGAQLDVFALNVASTMATLPYDYFSLPFCAPPSARIEYVRASNADRTGLGQILMGERTRLTAYTFNMRSDVECEVLCASTFDPPSVRTLVKRIVQGYRARLNLDDMPLIVKSSTTRAESANSQAYSMGYALGFQRVSPRRAESNVASGGKLPTSARFVAKLVSRARAAASMDTYVYNHLDFVVMYHQPSMLEAAAGTASISDAHESSVDAAATAVSRVVGFEVFPRSVQYPLVNPPKDSLGKPLPTDSHCITATDTPLGAQEALRLHFRPLAGLSKDARKAQEIENSKPQEIKFTYSVRFVESDVQWVTRFDPLLNASQSGKNRKIQYFAIINSLLLCLFLTSIFAVVLLRTLRRDCARYGFTTGNTGRSESVATGMASAGGSMLALDDFEDSFEADSGWRMLRGDVFRPPPSGELLCVLVGSGIQLVFVSLVTLSVCLFGVFRTERRGQLVTALIVTWALSSSIAGYVATSLHRAIGGTRWKLVTFGVSVVLPGTVFATFLVINTFLWAKGSIGAAPFVTLFSLALIWLGLSVPLAFAGVGFGLIRKLGYSFPVRTNQIPRQIPAQPSYLTAPFAQLVIGVLPFSVVAFELRQMWLSNEFYHIFIFMFAVFCLMVITCAEASVVVTYVRLAHEDWSWWWPAFWSAGSSGVYLFSYAIYTLITSRGADLSQVVSNVLFISYAGLLSLSFSLITGSIGLLSALVFVRRVFMNTSDD